MTSIDYLFVKLWNTDKDKLQWHSILDQAKKMHKKEIIDAYAHGQNNGYMYSHDKAINISKEHYYDNTFKKD